MSIGERIRIERERLDLSQEELAKKLEINSEMIVNWELGKNYPLRKYQFKLCDIFGCDIYYLLGELDNRNNI